MRQLPRLLWIRSAIPGPDYLGVVDHLSGFNLQVVKNPAEALERSRAEIPDVIFAEFPLAGWGAAELLEAIQEINPRVPVLIRDPQGSVADAVRLLKLGAYHFMSGSLDSILAEFIRLQFRKKRRYHQFVRVFLAQMFTESFLPYMMEMQKAIDPPMEKLFHGLQRRRLLPLPFPP
jgi:DNA-binding NarL/FixJ family response regulator